MNPFSFLLKWRDQIFGVSSILAGVVLIMDGKVTEGWAAISLGAAALFSGSY